MLIKNAKIYTFNAENKIIECGYVSFQNGLIAALGDMSGCPEGDDIVMDACGAMCLPGFVDAHAHVGMWEDSLGFEGDDGNEDTDPSTPHMRAIDAVNPLDRCFADALNAGVTSLLTGPGSANPIAGQIIAMKTYGRRIDDMILRAPAAIKFALGENPKTAYHAKNAAPVTRMATAAFIREQLYKTRAYMEQLDRAESDPDMDKPDHDIKCESLIPLLRGEIQAHFHAHRADDILTALRISSEFNIKPVIVHGTDGARIADILATEGVSVLCGPIICDRSKPELHSLDISTAAALCAAGVKTAIITDHPVTPIEYLPLSAALAVRGGSDTYEALKAITAVPAQIAGIFGRVGSIEPGKDADITLFDSDPLSIAGMPKTVFVDGQKVKGD